MPDSILLAFLAFLVVLLAAAAVGEWLRKKAPPPPPSRAVPPEYEQTWSGSGWHEQFLPKCDACKKPLPSEPYRTEKNGRRYQFCSERCCPASLRWPRRVGGVA